MIVNDQTVKKTLVGGLGSLILAGILGVGMDIAAAWWGRNVACSRFLLILAGLTILFFVLSRKKPEKLLRFAAGLLAVLCVAALLAFLSWWDFSRHSVFEKLDQGKTQLYAGQKVMLIVPHEDDDINVLGGVMEEYVRYGSDLYPVFVTNGDGDVGADPERRFREVLEVMEWIGGVPEENVTFLGYGDTWKKGGPHLYNAEPGVVMESAAGYTETYGTKVHSAYREGREYTSDHLLEDIHDVILQYRPDVIFCSDYDLHIDHRAVSLAFEKVMGTILKENPDYRPKVFKGYAYSSAWYSIPDFFAVNLLSTQNVFTAPYYQTPAVYRWEERVRLPVQDGSLARSLVATPLYDTLARYRSQRANFQATRVINGDKVFWYRDTNSLCLQADIQVSSGDGTLLNDFMLLEHSNLVDGERLPTDGTWVPVDGEKKATVTFREPTDVAELRLYDNPSLEDNVLAGVIQFSDGSEIPFGPLDPAGAVLSIPAQKTGITAFSVTLTETEGERAGLTELEAFAKQPDHGLRMVKLMDGDGNFLYDYWLPETERDTLGVYALGLSDTEMENLTLSWDNEKCWAKLEGGAVQVICPKGERMTLTIRLEGSDISDTIRIQNPGKPTRIRCAVCQYAEEQIFLKIGDRAYANSAVYKLLATLLG